MNNNYAINSEILHEEFVKLGKEKNKIIYKLLNLLPKILKSGLYLKHAKTIEEYAWKFGGLTKSSVQKRMLLEKRLEGKPFLKNAIEKVGIHKVSLLANLTTTENDASMADKAINMSKSSLEEMAKEIRAKKESEKSGEIVGLFEAENMDGKPQEMKTIPQESVKNPCRAHVSKMKIEFDDEMMFIFLKLKKKIGKDLSNREVLRKILVEMADEKLKSDIGMKARKSVTGDENYENEIIENKKITRYIRARIKKTNLMKTHGKCAYPGCQKPAEVLHHRSRFASNKSHESLIPLCKNHHEFAHNGLIKNEIEDPEKWEFRLAQGVDDYTDILYRKFRK